MIGFAVCVGSPEVYRRYAQAGIARCAAPDSTVAEIETDTIFAGYNEALDAFAPMGELEALVLLHEDVELRDPQLCPKLRRRFADESIAVIGVVGARDVRSLCWWEGEIRGRVTETRGVIDHGGGCHDVDAVDGLFMALSPWAVRELRFDDARFSGFHGYDVDLCLQAHAAGRRVVVDELEMTHHTRGGLGDATAFWQADAALRAKWSAHGRVMAPDAEMTPESRGYAVAARR